MGSTEELAYTGAFIRYQLDKLDFVLHDSKDIEY
jgi:hypothetical protein